MTRQKGCINHSAGLIFLFSWSWYEGRTEALTVCREARVITPPHWKKTLNNLFRKQVDHYKSCTSDAFQEIVRWFPGKQITQWFRLNYTASCFLLRFLMIRRSRMTKKKEKRKKDACFCNRTHGHFGQFKSISFRITPLFGIITVLYNKRQTETVPCKNPTDVENLIPCDLEQWSMTSALWITPLEMAIINIIDITIIGK